MEAAADTGGDGRAAAVASIGGVRLRKLRRRDSSGKRRERKRKKERKKEKRKKNEKIKEKYVCVNGPRAVRVCHVSLTRGSRC